MTPLQRLQASHKAAGQAIALCDQQFTEQEIRDAARGLGIESWLPEPQQMELMGEME
jgi:hypothetical protein